MFLQLSCAKCFNYEIILTLRRFIKICPICYVGDLKFFFCKTHGHYCILLSYDILLLSTPPASIAAGTTGNKKSLPICHSDNLDC